MNKITQRHIGKVAYIYIRQSTQQQVRENKESQRRQYDLANRARELGWNQIEVIDDDMGFSGSGVVERKGFARLVAAVGMGKVGAVFSLEASRLARNNKEWHQLVDLCGILGTLIIDQDGVYDASVLNDRLLLGMKGTMNEFELNLIRQRTEQGLREKAKRGELYLHLPAGYVLTPDNRCEKDPNQRVQDAIQRVFRKFDELGSARQVYLWFHHEDIELPTICYGILSWKKPFYNTIIRFLKNPLYAGAYAFGKTKTVSTFENGQRAKHGGVRVGRDAWDVLITDHHEGYISWDEYEANQRRFFINATTRGLMKTPGAPRCGKSLLAGLLRCGRCGRKLHVVYAGKSGKVLRYKCNGSLVNNGGSCCISVGGLLTDAAIAQKVLDVVKPCALEASIKASAELGKIRDDKCAALSMSLQEAKYEERRAFRHYSAVDPENRLVAGELEKRWNQALQRVKTLEDSLQKAQVERVDTRGEHSTTIQSLADDLPAIWHDERCSMRIKKMITRILIKEIFVDIDTDNQVVKMVLHWNGGVHSIVHVPKNKSGKNRYTIDIETLKILRELSLVMPDSAIAATLNRLGRKTGTGLNWNKRTVQSMRSRNSIAAYEPQKSPCMTMENAAKHLGISPMSVQRLIHKKIIRSEQIISGSPHVIQREHLESPEVRYAVELIQSQKKVPLPADPNQLTLNL